MRFDCGVPNFDPCMRNCHQILELSTKPQLKKDRSNPAFMVQIAIVRHNSSKYLWCRKAGLPSFHSVALWQQTCRSHRPGIHELSLKIHRDILSTPPQSTKIIVKAAEKMARLSG
jgi:hypothetical protein